MTEFRTSPSESESEFQTKALESFYSGAYRISAIQQKSSVEQAEKNLLLNLVFRKQSSLYRIIFVLFFGTSSLMQILLANGSLICSLLFYKMAQI